MNLHGIAGPIVALVNPTKYGKVHISAGYATGANGKQAPSYVTTADVPLQVQAMTGRELDLVAGLNIQGRKRAVYLYGDVGGLVRKEGKGGDLIEFDGSIWLVVIVFQTWPEWCKVGVAEQLDIVI